MIVPLSHVIALSLILFSIGVMGIFLRRDAITIFLSIEIVLNAANVAFIGFARASGSEVGHVAVLLVIAVAAAEAAIGLAIVVRLAERHERLRVDEIRELRG